MGLLQKLFKIKKRTENTQEYSGGDWNEVIYDRNDLKIDDRQQRQEYVKGCLDQIAEASRELENLKFEYNMVTTYLKDMEEIEALPKEEREILNEYARQIEELEGQKSGYLERESRMSDAQYKQMERIESEVQDGYEKLIRTEEYQELVKRDLRKLDGEKQAYMFRRNELRRAVEDSRSMAIVCTAAVVICILILLVLQFGFHMDIRLGYFAAAALGAVSITAIFIKHTNSENELKLVENGIGKIIRLQNTVKIRYVNNTNLLEYLYLKYNVTSAKELGKTWQQYIKEKEERERYYKAEQELDGYQKKLVHELRRYEIQDPMIWVHQTAALLDRREMVEIRHNLIIRRQSLRKRMEYNRESVAGKAQNEIKDLVEKYPKYAKEIVEAVGRYEKDFS